MKPTKHDDTEATYKDYLEIAFTVKDRNGNDVALAGATATYRVAEKGAKQVLVEKTETAGISLSGSIATVTLDTADLPRCGNYIDQLRITKSGKALMVSEGNLKLSALLE